MYFYCYSSINKQYKVHNKSVFKILVVITTVAPTTTTTTTTIAIITTTLYC